MMRCKRALIYRDRWGEHRFIPGRSHAAADTDYVRQHPEWFEVADDTVSQSRSRTTTRVLEPAAQVGVPAVATLKRNELPIKPHGFEPFYIPHRSEHLRIDTHSAVRVRFATAARVEVSRELDRAGDQLETGMLLFGSVSVGWAEVVEVVGCGHNANRTPTSFQFDARHNRQVTEEMAKRGLQRIGDVHTHLSAGGLPSEADLEAWHSLRTHLGLTSYVAMIVVRCRDSWELSPWVITGRTCRRAVIDAVEPR
jgi:proteasome lid subunit RPN8/RPN11